MKDDDKAAFLILATRQSSAPFTALFFVRAKSLADAYTQVLKDEAELCQHPDLRLQAHVVSTGMMANVLRLKEMAKFYFNAANGQDFEEVWEEHGADPDDA